MCKHFLLNSWCFVAWSPRVAGSSGEGPLLSRTWPRGGMWSRALDSKTTHSQPEHLTHPNTHSAHTACCPRPQEHSSSLCELFWRRLGTSDMPSTSCTVHACVRILSCHLQAASDQGCPCGCLHRLNDTKNEPQLQLSLLVHQWEFRNLAEDTGVVCIPALSHPVLTGDITNFHILAWKPQLLCFPALTVLTSPSLLRTPETHTFLEITVGLCFSSSCD